jgi:ApaG protein
MNRASTSPEPLSTPFTASLDGVTIRVAPAFLPGESEPEENKYFWAYTVEIENNRPTTITLRTRHWDIVDMAGGRTSVSGRGVVGQEPAIAPGGRFRYTSGAPLSHPSGMMRGHYDFDCASGVQLTIPIPAFSLDSPHDRARPS